jgi:hypothetical protein
MAANQLALIWLAWRLAKCLASWRLAAGGWPGGGAGVASLAYGSL